MLSEGGKRIFRLEAEGQVNGPYPYEIRPRAEQLHPRLLREAPGVRGAEEGARHETGRGHRSREGIGPARARRGGFSNRPQVAVRAQGHAEAEVHLLQRGRKRARDLQRSSADGAQSAPALRRVPDWL